MKYLICNLKANKTYEEMLLYKNIIKDIKSENTNIIIAPSIPYLSLFKDTNFTICAQDINLYDNLSLTGNITTNILKSLNVKYAIIGHYERRKYYHEDTGIILAKIKTSLKENIKVIYCIGETKEELERKVEYHVIEKDIAKIFNNISKDQFKNIIIAYEPAYMIGCNNCLNISKIAKIITFIKDIIKSYYNEDIKVIFGGNINPTNISEFKSIKDLDGFIIGSAILEPENIQKLIEKI